MSRKYLGDTLDIHTGGEDNIFPHHECEIAQSEGFTGKPFVRTWMHARHLLVNGRKMSKREGTFLTIDDVVEKKGYDPMVLRYALVSVHYRTNLNFTDEGLEASKAALERLRLAKGRLLETMKSGAVIEKPHEGMRKLGREGLKMFAAALEEDLNMSLALRHVFDFVTMANKFLDEGGVDAEDAQEGLTALMKMDSVMGVLEREEVQTLSADEEGMIRQREDARKRKDFAAADKIRANLRQRGIILEDTKTGPKWRRIR
jgi:cysteinyl-tRNA synthetase